MDATTLVVGVICLIVGIVLGRWSARPRTRVVWSESAKQWPPDAEIEALVRAGQKIYAIKRHRELHGTDLREAKDAIDALETRLLRNP